MAPLNPPPPPQVDCVHCLEGCCIITLENVLKALLFISPQIQNMQLKLEINIFFFLAQQPIVGQGRHIPEVSRPHTVTHHSR